MTKVAHLVKSFFSIVQQPRFPPHRPCGIRQILRIRRIVHSQSVRHSLHFVSLMYGFHRMSPYRKRHLCKQAYSVSFPHVAARTQCPSMFSINIPYPLVLSCTSTWVTAPINFPSWIIGAPLMPCTIPPVMSINSGSVM